MGGGILLVFLYLPFSSSAQTRNACWGYGVAEFLLPGLGYSLLGDWEKAAVFGGSRWAALLGAATFTRDEEYQHDLEKIYTQTERDGDIHADIFLTRETFYGNLSLSIFNNLTSITIHDLYETSCQKNPNTYGDMLSPFQLQSYGTRSTFLLPMTALLGALVASPRTRITYHVEANLTRNEILVGSFLENQLVGIGEEMLFRGLIQRNLFAWFSRHYSHPVARWSSIVSASVLFGLAHNGLGGTAGPGFAFLSGLYLGWVYHPAVGEYDLPQAIALHSWWDTLIDFYRVSRSDVKELEKRQLQGLRYAPPVPLLNMIYRF